MLVPNTRLEGIGVLGPRVLDGLFSNQTGSWSVSTIGAVAALTETLGGKALAI
jgi:hypothetical protein